MHHVLTLPRALRRDDAVAETATWAPIAVPAPDTVEAPAIATTRRVVRQVDGVGIGSVVKLALLFYGFVFACLAGGVLIVWTAISAMGYVDRFEDFMSSIGFRGFEVSSDNVIVGLIGVGGSLTLLATFLTVAAACAYNLVGSVGHGLVLRMSEPVPNDTVPEPITDEPITDEPITDEPNTDEPITDGAPHAA